MWLLVTISRRKQCETKFEIFTPRGRTTPPDDVTDHDTQSWIIWPGLRTPAQTAHFSTHSMFTTLVTQHFTRDSLFVIVVEVLTQNMTFSAMGVVDQFRRQLCAFICCPRWGAPGPLLFNEHTQFACTIPPMQEAMNPHSRGRPSCLLAPLPQPPHQPSPELSPDWR